MKEHTSFLYGYAADICERIDEILAADEVELIAMVYEIDGDSSFDVVRFEQVPINSKVTPIKSAWVNDISVITDRFSEDIQNQIETEKFIRVYTHNHLYIMKPPCKRFWSPREAVKDAAMIIDDYMEASQESKPKAKPPEPVETSKHATKKRPSRRTRNTQISAHPVIYNDQTYIWIDGFENVRSSGELTEEYLRGTPSYYQSDEGNVCVSSGKRPTVFRVGSSYPVERFDELMDTMKAAGERFTAIRRRAAFVVEI